MPEFHRLSTDSKFPGVENIDVFQYDNDLDYSRFNIKQMSLQLCDVPWDVGEAHVGNRTISGIGNVVYFETPEKRDVWFDAIPEAEPGQDPKGKCFRWSTKFKELHREQIIDIPIPYNVAALFNYLVVTYEPFASEGDFLDYETGLGKLKWFWFVRDVEFVAPNTTRLHLLDDAFQTWIYDVNVAGMVLERGHAPMFAMKASAYLQNPIANNQGLLTEDVNYGQADIVSHIDALALNGGDMWACIATSAAPTGAWGSKAEGDWKVPVSASYVQGGVPSSYVFAMETADLSTFFSTIAQSYPQFSQTVQAVFFAPKNLVTVSTDFTFATVTCHRLSSSRQTLNLSQLTKQDFNYPSQYDEIAKLYTSPYAHVEIVDENGNVDVVKVEDTSGKIDVSAALSLAYPFITINAHLLGCGGTPAPTITFRNVSSHTFKIQGTWYETLREWEVPTFAIFQSAAKAYDYGSYFDREQAKLAYANQYDSTAESATTAKANSNASDATAQTNSKASAETAKSNTAVNASASYDNAIDAAKVSQSNANSTADAEQLNANDSATTQTNNAALQTTANSAITSKSNAAALKDTELANLLSVASQAYEAGFTFATTNNQVQAEQASAAVGVGGGIAGSAVQGLMSGGPVGAVGGLISGAISGATSMVQTSISTNLTSAQASEAVSLSANKTTSTNNNNTERTTNQNGANTSNTNTTNSAISGTAANIAATMKGNAKRSNETAKAISKATYDMEEKNSGRVKKAVNDTAKESYDTAIANAKRSYDTGIANASRTYDAVIENAERARSTASSAIVNGINQAALGAPDMFGSFSNGSAATTKPMALFANVVTQSRSAIAAAGDYFLRYGYSYGMQWDFNGNWNVGKYFTYWKLSDFWVRDLQVPDLYMDKLRFFLFGGVTIWRKPEYIGKVSIYDNFNG